MRDNLSGNCPHLSLPALRLLVSPIHLVSAAVWQTIQHNAVAHYGMLEEFVSMVTDVVPELLTSQQRAQLILGLRARLILELCQFEDSAHSDIIQPHLDRMQMLIEAWVNETGTTNVDLPNSDFVDLIKDMLEDPEMRETFYQTVFPEEFGPAFDEALCTLTCLLLTRLEKFLPLQTFKQVASMFGNVSSVLQDCMMPVTQGEELRIMLQYQRENSQLDHNDGSLDGACIISALKLCSVKTTKTRKQEQDAILDHVPSHTEMEVVPSAHTMQTNTHSNAEHQTSEIKPHKTNLTPRNLILKFRRCDENVALRHLDTSASSQLPSVRKNKGLKMKMLLLKEKKGVSLETHSDSISTQSKEKASKAASQDVSNNKDSGISANDSAETAPDANCSEDDSWSYYSDDNSLKRSCPSSSDSWSYYSDATSYLASPGKSPAEYDSLSSCSDEDFSFKAQRTLSTSNRKPGITDTNVTAQKKTLPNVYCFICEEFVNTRLKDHMKTHFPSGDYVCPRCKKRFKLFPSFRAHLRKICFEHAKKQVDAKNPLVTKNHFKCDKCEEVFVYKVSLARHKKTHDELYCSVCRKVLRDAATLARHKASHTVFHCIRCEETFPIFVPLLRHCENVHKIGRPFKCNHCPKTFPKLRMLILHEWKHTGHLPFQCAECGSRFRCDADLVYHERVHTREKPYLCPECGKTFAQNSNLMRHMHLIHSEFRNLKKHSCSQCEKSFKEKGALKKHERSKHFNELFRHPCPYCGKLLSASTIGRHKLIHTGQTPFKCTVPECDKSFRSKIEVKNHFFRYHTSERPFKCDVCGKGFIRIGFRNAHAKIHLERKPFACHICGKAFPKLYSMERHKRLVHKFVTQ